MPVVGDLTWLTPFPDPAQTLKRLHFELGLADDFHAHRPWIMDAFIDVGAVRLYVIDTATKLVRYMHENQTKDMARRHPSIGGVSDSSIGVTRTSR